MGDGVQEHLLQCIQARNTSLNFMMSNQTSHWAHPSLLPQGYYGHSSHLQYRISHA